jgi:hypothetical protein
MRAPCAINFNVPAAGALGNDKITIYGVLVVDAP